jgi:hypothetical protein
MLQPLDDHAKQRLVDREDILTAIGILSAEGLDVEQMLGEMTKLFYVDLDEFNDIVGMVQPHSHQAISLNS